MSAPPYAELHCLSQFSFGRGASGARELFERAKACRYQALAITDECTLAGIVRALEAAKQYELKLIVGAEFQLSDGPKLVLLVQNLAGYQALSKLITRGRRRAKKGNYTLSRADFASGLPGTLALWLPDATRNREHGAWLSATFYERTWLAVELHRGPDDATLLAELLALAEQLALPCVASGDVHMHVRARRALQDTLTAIRHKLTLKAAGAKLFPNGERHLRKREVLASLYPPALLEASVQIAELCTFSLHELRYEYPRELVPEGHTASSWLRSLTEQGMRWRWPEGPTDKVNAQIQHELALISELHYESYFLTVHEIVEFARSQDILCQGRGSAANSSVCFALGITEVDPAHANLLFERFISRERNEPPDIDIDFEHERREEVIQHIYQKYGRERAALAATVSSYRAKSAVRDIAKALGLPPDQLEQLSAAFAWWNGVTPITERLAERGFDPQSPVLRRVIGLTGQLLDAPRHLSQHVGGFVISQAPLYELVPVENAAMPERSIIQWDKDDLDTLGLLKIDCLALGMLTCIAKCLKLLKQHRNLALTPASIPAADAATYAMIQRADTVGVFQIESRAQMAMLPRHKPACFYDLVIQVAIVRPGPIQGKMVHPYLRRRQQIEPVSYPSEALKAVFERTLGVPLFQEQVMQLAIVAAGFTPGEADQLRRAMAAWKRRGGLEYFRKRILDGMQARNYDLAFAEQVFEQIKGFGSYGFPESHAASFALITYVSCWLKCHEPAAFTCALINSQPLGFYTNSQLVQDVRKHGITVRPIDVRFSDFDSTLEPWPEDPQRQPAIRLGLREIRGFAQAAAERLLAVRRAAPLSDVETLCVAAQLDRRERALLADAAALRGLAGHRHRARWAIEGVEKQLPLFPQNNPESEPVHLSVPSTAMNTWADYASTGLTLGAHPLAQLRGQLSARKCQRSRDLRGYVNGRIVRTAGLVTMRQRPSTASGVTFVTLEDEDGMLNVVVWRALAEVQRRVLIESRLLGVDGRWESNQGVQHLIATRLHDYSALLGALDTRSRDFH